MILRPYHRAGIIFDCRMTDDPTTMSSTNPARFTAHGPLCLNAQRRQRTIFLAMKNSIIFISALSLVAMMLASCNSIPSAFAPDETATTGVRTQTNETRPERSAEDSVNSISGGHY
jgi:hypothetical protein